MTTPTTLVELLRARASERPAGRAYRFLLDGESEEAALTYGELDRQARAIGAAVRGLGGTGERVLLLYPPGLQFIAAFFGCLYGGATAVPASPPRRARPDRTLDRFRAIVADARPRIALTTSADLTRAQGWLAGLPDAERVLWLATDGIADELAEDWQAPAAAATAAALLQYTSGSTAAPKGVVVSHGNILHNESLIQGAFGQSDESIVVGWLPFYHDMGLMGNVIQPLYVGCEAVLMSPMAFLQRPIRWPRAISSYRGTTSGGPSFAYDLLVRRTTPEQRSTLDLACWSVAFNGSEPVRSEVMAEFAAAFAGCGFRREAFFPCYGLAEATLLVSAGSPAPLPAEVTVESAALERHELIAPAAAGGGRTLVSCGRIAPDQRLLVVSPQDRTVCPPERVGEIWVSGPSVAQGYWNRPAATEETFGAHLAGTGEGPYLRTGDLGFLKDGELYVTGRVKDLIIIRGKNHYPQDLEWTVQQSHPSLRRAACAAFSVEAGNEERLVVLAELDRRQEGARRGPAAEAAGIVETVRRAVADGHGLQVYALSLVRAGALPRTTSGKLERHACRAGFLVGSLEVLETSVLDPEEPAWSPEDLDREALLGLGEEARRARLESYLRDQVAAALRTPRPRVAIDQPLNRFGLDSLMAIELSHRIETDLGVSVSSLPFLQGLTIAEIAAQAARELTGPPAVAAAPGGRPARPAGECRLSHGQEALWFLQRLAPESAHYNIAAAARIAGDLDLPAFERALQTLVERHPSLRTRFTAPLGKPVQRIAAHGCVQLEVVVATDWSAERLDERMAERAYLPFDLEQGPLLRVCLFRRSAHEHLAVLAVHHMVADFWSLTVLMDELGRCYAAEVAGEPPALDPLPLDYADFVAWQAEAVAGDGGEALWRYWQKQLAGPLPDLDLRCDRPRPPRQSYRGSSRAVSLGGERTRALKALGDARGSTLFTTLLAAFQVLLHRYTGQDDVLVGSPMSGRTRAALAGVVGYFVNPVVLRADLSADPTFEAFLARERETVLGAIEHQDYPFALLVERLQPVRDPSRSPLFQVMFILQKAHQLAGEGLSAFALGEAGARVDLWGLALESVALEKRMAPFDLTLTMAEIAGELSASFEYNTDLFDAGSIARLADHFLNLLDSITADPGRRVSELALMGEAEVRRLLVEWNGTEAAAPRAACIHHQLESQAASTPEAVALVFEGQVLSFDELNRRANQLSRHLRRHGVGPQAPVGLYLERSPELLVALLGVLKAGAAYLPLDPGYPKQRTAFMLADSRARTVVTQRHLVPSLPEHAGTVIALDSGWPAIAREEDTDPIGEASGDQLAYVIYTSGSTGTPKGVMIRHRSVANFFLGMDRAVGCGPADSLLAVTSLCFDISVLELLWTLSRGARVLLLSERAVSDTAVEPAPGREGRAERDLGFSLFYFANADSGSGPDRYRLLLEGAKFADRHGFEAVWTPERHFHAFGGLYPSPAVTSAAVAAVTERIEIRAGSVVMPLHDPIRVAEDWSVVDNLSRGRVGVSFASGWHANDFALAPDRFEERKALMYRGIETVQRLWRGEAIPVRNGAGDEIEVRIHPRPLQAELPIWITAAGAPDTFVKAGEIGANLLTHLLGQTLEEVAEKVALYRDSRARHGHDPRSGRVTLMLHTFVGPSIEAVRETVRAPLTGYLKTSVGLIASLVKGIAPGFDVDEMAPDDLEGMLTFAFDRYVETSGLFGTPDTCLEMVARARAADVDEIACLIDFGVEAEAVLESLRGLDRVRERSAGRVLARGHSLPEQARRYGATLFQCTPSLMTMLALEPATLAALEPLRALMLGGEGLPPPLAAELGAALPGRLLNMYGPTETTVWSTTEELAHPAGAVAIGRPIANTRVYVLDRHGRPVPVGVPGELHIGGEGLAQGYLARPALTAERFVPEAFGGAAGARLYRTGDLALWLADGRLECLGRVDQQAKIRGFRVELGEIEAVLGQHPAVREAAVVAQADGAQGSRLVAYLVPRSGGGPDGGELRGFLKERLPDFMVPGSFVTLAALPRTPNGKLDRKALPAASGSRPELAAAYVAPQSDLEQAIAAIWRQVLKVEKVGIYDNFFDLGGHSLLMAQVQSQVKGQLKHDLPLIKMLEHPTVSALTRHLTPGAGEGRPGRREGERAALQRAGLRRQSRAALASRRLP